MDNGHYHPTEVVSDKIPALLAFFDEIALHVTRPIRWDSDHVVLFDDETKEIAKEIVNREGVKFVMIAGPSSSGKTTFIQPLEIIAIENEINDMCLRCVGYTLEILFADCEENVLNTLSIKIARNETLLAESLDSGLVAYLANLAFQFKMLHCVCF